MKRIVLFIMLMALAWSANANHWTPVTGPYANTATMIGVIQLEGVEQRLTTLEVGAFCGDECRGSATPMYVSQLDRYILFMSLYGNDGDELGFRLFDQSLNQESDLACESTVTFASNAAIGSGSSPYVLDFEVVILSFPITATADPIEGGTVTGGGTFEQGTEVTMIATASTGYTFVHWTEGDEEVSTDANYSFTVTEARDLVAHFSLNSYAINVTVNPMDGGAITGDGVYDHGATAVLTATAAIGYSFVHWTEGGTVVSNNPTYAFTVTGERTLVAHFSLNTYYVVLVADPMEGGAVSGAGAFNYGTSTVVTAVAAPGYTFANWTEDGLVVCTTTTYAFTVTGHRTITAHFISEEEGGHWTPNAGSYANTATLIGVVQIDGVEQRATNLEVGAFCGDECRGSGKPMLVPQLDRYILFMSLYGNEGDVLSFRLYDHELGQELLLTCATTVTFASNGISGSGTSLYVLNFESTGSTGTIAATADPVEGGTVTGVGVYDLGATAMLTATPAEGYAFVHWTEGEEVVSTDSVYSFMVTSTRTLVAHFGLKTYEVMATVNPTEGGTITGTGTYDHFAICTLTATPAEGYAFVNWTEGDEEVSTSAEYSFTVSSAKTLVAHFSLNQYEIAATSDPTAGGSVSGAGSYDHGATATLTATASEGYTFINWTEDDVEVSTAGEFSFTVTGARTLVAHFSLNDYAINATADPISGGAIEGAGTYQHGVTATLTATPNEGYNFVNWTEGGTVVSNNPSYAFTVTGPRNLVAHFSINSYFVIVSADPVEGGIVSGAGSFDHGASVIVTADAAEGYLFVNWTENGEEVCTTSTYSFTVTGHRTLVAHFVPEAVNFHWTANTGLYANTATVIGVILIDSVEQRSTDLEVGAFCGDECRGSGMPMYVSQLDRFILFMSLYGNDGDVIDFRLYDHGLGQELDLTCVTSVTFVPNGTSGSGSSLYALNFVNVLPVHDVTVTVTPPEGGSVEGAGAYDLGATATLTAIANEGYTFVNWTEDGEEVSTDSVYAFTVTGDCHLMANFMEDLPAVITHWTPETDYPDAMMMIGIIELYGVEQRTTALEVGAFCGDECRGSQRLSYLALADRFVVRLTVYGEEGDLLTFMLYNHDKEEELELGLSETIALNGEGYGNLSNQYGLNFTATALPVQQEAVPITLNPGWTWISYTLSSESTLESALEHLTPADGDMLKGQGGFSTFDGNTQTWRGSVSTFSPGKGYMYLNNSSEVKVFSYPVSGK